MPEDTDRDLAHLSALSAQRWEAHARVHEQEHEALRLALVNLEKRLDALNELRGLVGDRDRQFVTFPALTALTQAVDEFKTDTRRRFEAMDVLMRAEARPGQDLKSNWGAIIGFIGLLAVLLGIYLSLQAAR